MTTTPAAAESPSLPQPSQPQSKRAYESRDPNKRRDLELKVWQLRVRRYSFREIGHALGVPSSTAHWIYSQFEKRNDRSFKDLTARKVADELIGQAKQRVQSLNALYKDTNNDSIKLGAVNAMRAEMEHIKECAQSLGVLYREPERVESDALDIIAEELRKLVPRDQINALATSIRGLASLN